MKTIDFSPDLKLPVDVVTQTIPTNKSKPMSEPSGKLVASPRPRPVRPSPDEAGEGRGLSKGGREMLKALGP